MNLNDTQKAMLYDALIADGVDNWEGFQESNYQKAMSEIELENQRGEIFNEIQDLFEIICNPSNLDIDYPAGREAGIGILLNKQGEDEIIDFIFRTYKQ